MTQFPAMFLLLLLLLLLVVKQNGMLKKLLPSAFAIEKSNTFSNGSFTTPLCANLSSPALVLKPSAWSTLPHQVPLEAQVVVVHFLRLVLLTISNSSPNTSLMNNSCPKLSNIPSQVLLPPIHGRTRSILLVHLGYPHSCQPRCVAETQPCRWELLILTLTWPPCFQPRWNSGMITC